MQGSIYQINIKPETPGQRGLPKCPVNSIARVAYSGITWDFNRYRHEEKHDDPDMAILLLPFETIQRLNEEGWPISPGDMGENFTTLGIPYDRFAPGKIYSVRSVIIQISRPCTACRNLYLLPYIGDQRGPEFLKTLTWKEEERIINRRGWYARVLKEGFVSKKDVMQELEKYE